MAHEQETKTCQQCNEKFTIEPEDFQFYKKMDVPAPTFCYLCRFQRRLMFRNERTLYKRKCDFSEKDLISMYAPEKPYTVYDQEVWWSDNWDPFQYGRDYDPNRPFFEQLKELFLEAPIPNLLTAYTTLTNSPYINSANNCKNCYLSFVAAHCEEVFYSNFVTRVKDSMDVFMVSDSELCYEVINGSGFRLYYSEDCHSCNEVYFSKNCNGCNNCFGCVNLRNQSYCWFNEQLTKEEYEQRLRDARLDSYQSVEEWRTKAESFWLQFPVKYYHGVQNENATGEYIYNSKNLEYGYMCSYAEDVKYSQFLTVEHTKDCYDVTEYGDSLELCLDTTAVGQGARGIKYCYATLSAASDNEYCFHSRHIQNCFGCCSLKEGQYCILNKQYSKEEYFKMRDRIIQDMNENPYIDSSGRVWKYGDFFPYDLGHFAYNESQASEYFPLSKEETLAQGFSWRDETPSGHEITLTAEQIPDSSNEIDESITEEVLGCESCDKAYRIVSGEYKLLQQLQVPVPRLCHDCRHMRRLRKINPPKLWNRVTEDGKEVMTSYPPDSPAKIYSEEGYNDLIY